MHSSSEANGQDDTTTMLDPSIAAQDGSVHANPSNEPNNQNQMTPEDDDHNQNPQSTDQAQVNTAPCEAAAAENIPIGVRNATTILTVAVLLASVTYQAAYNPPGGVWQQEDGPTGLNTTQIKQEAGVSILATTHKYFFIFFVLGNTLGFLFSMATIEDHTCFFTRKLELNLAIAAISVTYVICVSAISPSEYRVNMTITVVAAIFFVILVRERRELWKHLKSLKKYVSCVAKKLARKLHLTMDICLY